LEWGASGNRGALFLWLEAGVAKFTYSDDVRVKAEAPAPLRAGAVGSVIAVFETRPGGSHFAEFPRGVVYSIEYADGSATDVHEDHLEPNE
jgi:hypothetical protein